MKPNAGVAAPLPIVARYPMNMRVFCQPVEKHLGVVLSICRIVKAPPFSPPMLLRCLFR